MWNVLKKNKEKESSSTERTVRQVQQNTVIQSSRTHTQTVTRRYSETATTSNYLSSQLLNINLNNQPSNSLRIPAAKPRPSFSAEQIQSDARPINLEYVSPYRKTSAVYNTYNNLAGTSLPSNATPLYPYKTTSTSNYPSQTSLSSMSSTSSVIKDNPKDTKKIVVKISGNRYDDINNVVPTYKTSSKNRGEVLIINNIQFKQTQERYGAKLDDANLKELFLQIGFKVSCKRNLKASEMKKEIKGFSKNTSLKKADIAVVVVMSHGTNKDIIGGYTEILGTDDNSIPIDQVLEYFSTNSCPQMANKPKIFIFQCCRGEEFFIKQDAVPIINDKKGLLTDMLIAYSTLPGYASHRNPLTGSWYIQTIVKVFSKYAHEYDVEELLKIVGQQLSTVHPNIIQTSSYENRGFKKCYLHPMGKR